MQAIEQIRDRILAAINTSVHLRLWVEPHPDDLTGPGDAGREADVLSNYQWIPAAPSLLFREAEMPGHSGYRPGRGRKADVEKYGGHIDAAEQRIVQALPRLIDNMLALASGIYEEKTLPDGKTVVVYERPPDRLAIEYLINRIMGKPTEQTELIGQDGGPLTVINLGGSASMDDL
jgi:hypothetical protein